MEDNKITKWHRIPVPKFTPVKKRKRPFTAPLLPRSSTPGPSTLGLSGATPNTELARGDVFRSDVLGVEGLFRRGNVWRPFSVLSLDGDGTSWLAGIFKEKYGLTGFLNPADP